MAEKKEKQYVSDNAQLMAEWDWEKNYELKIYPETLTVGSGKKVWWKCQNGHEWKATIHSRKGEHGCPYCSGKIAIVGENDLQTVNPELAKQWNYEKNGKLTPRELLPNSNKKVWWKCDKGHEWKALVSHRNKGVGCPYCAGIIAISGENDLQAVNPELAKEWNYEKNSGLTPLKLLPNSNKKVWWKCNKGHEWQAKIADRNKGTGCPICQSERHTSFPEYIIEYYIKKSEIDVIHSYKSQGYELDIFIPSKAIAIEYDGYYWHKDKTDEDLAKNQKCKRDGIKLYRVREGLLSLNDSSIDYIVKKSQKDLSEILSKLLNVVIGTSVDIDLERDAFEIDALREYTEKENSLLVSNPQTAKEWNYEKNGTLKPENFLSNSTKKVWWKCDKGHEWQATIADRNNGNGCPYCSGNKILVGYNDLQTLCPELAKQWHPNKNSNLLPCDVAVSSGKKVWWKCDKGHEWQAIIANRSKGSGCPYCASKKVLKGFNDLRTSNPTLANEWNYEKNNELTPEEFTVNSERKVWWKCSQGHEWQARISNRNHGYGCPYCSGRYAIKGENDLQTINPLLASEWNYEKNDVLTPTDVLPNSTKKVWWKCSQGHEWQAIIGSRNKGCGCPECAKQKRKTSK